MAEYIDIDAPIDVAVYQRNRRIQVTLRQILESNDAKYECSDVVERKKGEWIVKQTALGSEYTICSSCKTDVEYKFRNKPIAMLDMREARFCPNCGSRMGLDGDTE